MALTVLASCAVASEESGVSSSAVLLTVIFGAYIALDSALASVMVSRKAAEAERVSLMLGEKTVEAERAPLSMLLGK